MTLTELSVEYTRSAENMQEMIRANTARLHDAVEQGDHERELLIRRTLNDLRFQREHLLDVAQHLKTYYDPSPRRIH